MRIAVNDLLGQIVDAAILQLFENAGMVAGHLDLASARRWSLLRILRLAKVVPSALFGRLVLGTNRLGVSLAEEISCLASHRLDIDLAAFFEL